MVPNFSSNIVNAFLSFSSRGPEKPGPKQSSSSSEFAQTTHFVQEALSIADLLTYLSDKYKSIAPKL